jgi:hypothetical protein
MAEAMSTSLFFEWVEIFNMELEHEAYEKDRRKARSGRR